MANSIAKAREYVENEQSLQKLFRGYALTQDLAKPFVGKGNGTVTIKTVTLGSNTAGSYADATGYTAMDLTVAFVDKTPSQDKGNALHIDRLADEGAMGDSLVQAYNRYARQVMNPTIDKANLSAIAGTTGITSHTDATVSAVTIKGIINAGLDSLFNAGLSAEAPVVLYIKASASRFLKDSLASVGGFKYGEWNGVVDSKVAIYGDTIKAKVVEVPDSYMPTNTTIILCPVDAVDFVVVNRESTFITGIAGFGNRKVELDIGFCFDAWVKPEAVSLIYKSVTA